jgi:hypothetical protein
MRLYIVLQALFGEHDDDTKLNKTNVGKFGEHLKGVCADGPIAVEHCMGAFELYIHEHEDALKPFPLVCKALYDLDSIFDDAAFVKYYKAPEKKNKNQGHSVVREKIQPFVEWLEDDSDDDSDSDSD